MRSQQRDEENSQGQRLLHDLNEEGSVPMEPLEDNEEESVLVGPLED